MGRKKIEGPDRNSKTVSTAIPESMFGDLQLLAMRNGCRVSAMLRKLVVEAVEATKAN